MNKITNRKNHVLLACSLVFLFSCKDSIWREKKTPLKRIALFVIVAITFSCQKDIDKEVEVIETEIEEPLAQPVTVVANVYAVGYESDGVKNNAKI